MKRKRLDVQYYPNWHGHIGASIEEQIFDFGGRNSLVQNIERYGTLPIYIPISINYTQKTKSELSILEEKENNYNLGTNNCSHQTRKVVGAATGESLGKAFFDLLSVELWPWLTARQACRLGLKLVDQRKQRILERLNPPKESKLEESKHEEEDQDPESLIKSLIEIEIERLELAKCELQLSFWKGGYQQLDRQLMGLEKLNKKEIHEAAKELATNPLMPKTVQEVCQAYSSLPKEESKKLESKESKSLEPVSTARPLLQGVKKDIHSIAGVIAKLRDQKLEHSNDFFTRTYVQIDRDIQFLKRILEKKDPLEQYQLIEAGLSKVRAETQPLLRNCLGSLRDKFQKEIQSYERGAQLDANLKHFLAQYEIKDDEKSSLPQEKLFFQKFESYFKNYLQRDDFEKLNITLKEVYEANGDLDDLRVNVRLAINYRIKELGFNSQPSERKLIREKQLILLESEMREKGRLSISYNLFQSDNTPLSDLSRFKGKSFIDLPMPHIRVLAYLNSYKIKLEHTYTIFNSNKCKDLKNIKILMKNIYDSPQQSLTELLESFKESKPEFIKLWEIAVPDTINPETNRRDSSHYFCFFKPQDPADIKFLTPPTVKLALSS